MAFDAAHVKKIAFIKGASLVSLDFLKSQEVAERIARYLARFLKQNGIEVSQQMLRFGKSRAWEGVYTVGIYFPPVPRCNGHFQAGYDAPKLFCFCDKVEALQRKVDLAEKAIKAACREDDLVTSWSGESY